MGPEPTPTTRPVTAVWLAGGGEMGELMRALDWARTPLGPRRALAAEPAQRGQHPAAVQGADHPVLGSGPHRPLQRRLPAGLRRQAPGRARPCRRARRGARSGTQLRPLFEGVMRTARRSGPATSCSSSSATATSRRPTSTSPTTPCATRPGGSAASSASSPRPRAAWSASGGCGRCASSAPRPSAASPRKRVRPARQPILAENPRRPPVRLAVSTSTTPDARHGLVGVAGLSREARRGVTRRSTSAAPAAAGCARAARPKRPRPLRGRSSAPAAVAGPRGRARRSLAADHAVRLPRRRRQPAPRARRRLPRRSSTWSPASRHRARQRPRLRGGAPARRGARRARPREDGVLQQRQPRVPHAAHADARAARGRCCAARHDHRSGRPRAARRRCTATRCACSSW